MNAKEHALSVFPQESCGIVVDDKYIPCENIAENPLLDFRIDDKITLPFIANGTLQKVIHSHPVKQILAKSSPSSSDMRGQISSNVPWGIIDTDGEVVNDPYFWGDFKLDEELYGVEFHHGVQDCYTAVRKWYWQMLNIKLADIPRDDEWWVNGEDLYTENFDKWGFIKISPSDIKHGDVMLGKVLSARLNHAGVFVEGGLVYHHLPGRLSRREPASNWINRADLILRYNAN